MSTTAQSGGGPGPIFIAGRQHSGNTVTAVVFGMVPDCLVVNVEGWFFEQRSMLDRISDSQRRANHLVDLLRLESPELAEHTRVHLIDWSRRHAGASSIEFYCQAMRFAMAGAGKSFWVRRATSYIFHAEEILELMPEARILYLLRNPYDICASLKRRNPKVDRFAAMVVGWNRGLRLALRLRESYPDRLLIVHYEDMVTRPVPTFRDIFRFAGVPFHEEYLDVPQVNPSEAKQSRTSATRGLRPSRVHYYTGVLTAGETAAVDMLVWKRKCDEYYPDLPHRRESRRFRHRVAAVMLLCLSPYRSAAHQSRLLLRQGWRARRLLRRVGILFR